MRPQGLLIEQDNYSLRPWRQHCWPFWIKNVQKLFQAVSKCLSFWRFFNLDCGKDATNENLKNQQNLSSISTMFGIILFQNGPLCRRRHYFRSIILDRRTNDKHMAAHSLPTILPSLFAFGSNKTWRAFQTRFSEVLIRIPKKVHCAMSTGSEGTYMEIGIKRK